MPLLCYRPRLFRALLPWGICSGLLLPPALLAEEGRDVFDDNAITDSPPVLQARPRLAQAASDDRPAQGEETILPAVTVTAPQETQTTRGSRDGRQWISPTVQVGVLGDRPLLDTPFTLQSYTRDLIEAQQSRTLADVVKNDASARNNLNAGGLRQ